MPLFERGIGAVSAFFSALSDTLDIDLAVKKAGITKDDAAEMLRRFSRLADEMIESAPHARKEHLPGAAPVISEKPHGQTASKKHPYTINVDGASRGNPGKAGAGAVIKDGEGNVVKELRAYLGIATNNKAEYGALIMALTAAVEMGVKHVNVFADSELMVKQIKGEYRVKSEDLRPLYQKAMKLATGFDGFSIKHVRREENALADSLANEAIDKRAG